MSTNIPNIPNGFVLVPVQSLVQSGGAASVISGSVPGSSPANSLLKFKWSSPQAMGTVEIMVGLMLFLIGVVLCFFGDTLTVYSGVFAWAPICYIVAGSLTVAADKSMNSCLIKGSMGMNIVAAMMSCTATVLYGLDGAGILIPYYPYPDYPYPDYNRYDAYYARLSMGVSGVQSVFNLLVFIISICLSAFGCKATCCQQTPLMQAVVIGNHLPEGMVTSLATHSSNAPPRYSEAGHTHPGSSQVSGK